MLPEDDEGAEDDWSMLGCGVSLAGCSPDELEVEVPAETWDELELESEEVELGVAAVFAVAAVERPGAATATRPANPAVPAAVAATIQRRARPIRARAASRSPWRFDADMFTSIDPFAKSSIRIM